MTRIHRMLAFSAVVLAAVSARPAVAQIGVKCVGELNQSTSVAAPGQHTAAVDFSASGGGLDPTPLLSTSITVVGTPGSKSCLIAHFSTLAVPQDNSVVFQVSVDGVPMTGHGLFPGFSTPVVIETEETNINQPRVASYNFFAQVSPGRHTVRVRYAGCCSSNPNNGSGVVQSPVLTLQYR